MTVFVVLRVTVGFGVLTQHTEDDNPCALYGDMPNIEITSPDSEGMGPRNR